MARRGMGVSSIVTGFGFYFLARRIELLGDLSPIGSEARLGYHLAALALIVIALVAFLRGGLAAFRTITGRAAAPARKKSRMAEIADEEISSFDADAALARYMQQNRSEPRPAAPIPAPPAPVRTGFGRKAV